MSFVTISLQKWRKAMDDCSFYKVCMVFKKDACTVKNIDNEECQGPLVKGVRIWGVAKINNGNYKIAIISQCPVCKKLWGIVNGDTEPVSYRLDSVELHVGKQKIPYAVCKNCSGTKNLILSETMATI